MESAVSALMLLSLTVPSSSKRCYSAFLTDPCWHKAMFHALYEQQGVRCKQLVWLLHTC
jgi:hypothetical protein